MASSVNADPAATGPSGDSASPVDEHDWPGRRQSYYSLFVLTVVVMFTVLDRQIMALMIDPIKADFGISDTQAALLLGAAFSITYGLAGMPIARIADTRNRRNLIAICIAFWSLCTMACGVVQSYAGMFLARIGIGVGESGYGPATWSIVTDSFPRERVAFATGTLGIGAMAGIGLASFTGGAVLAFVEHLPPVPLPFGGVIRSWQWAFILVGLPGLLWGLVVLTTREPARRGVARGKRAQTVPVREVARWVIDDGRTYLAVIGGACMKVLLAAGPSTWGVTLLHREFGWALSKAGMISGAATLIVSPVAMIIGGKISEHWTRKGVPDANLRIVFLGLIFSVPFLVMAPILPNPYLVVACNAVAVFVGTLGFGPGVAAFQVITPGKMRAQVSSLAQFSTNVIAFALSPLIVALFTDYLFRDPSALKYSMALSAGLMGFLAILVTWQGLGPYADRSNARCAKASEGSAMSNIESIEIIDAQIHEPWPGHPLAEDIKPLTSLLQVELAREAMDSIGVDMALAVTDDAFIALAHELYPGRFPGVHTFFPIVPDFAEGVRRVRADPAMVAGRALIGNFVTAEMRPEFDAGAFDSLYATAEEVGLPIFNSTHGGCAKLAAVAEKHPSLTLIVDHIGVAQHPVSPPETMSWRTSPTCSRWRNIPISQSSSAARLCSAASSFRSTMSGPIWTGCSMPSASIG
ncbi:MAG: MFS transporter [Sphingomonas sp.]